MLGLRPEDLHRHIAFDLGAEGVAAGLAEALGAPAILSRFSRLLIDPNRGLDDPTLIMQISDGLVVPGNVGLSAAETEARLDHSTGLTTRPSIAPSKGPSPPASRR